MTNDKSQEVLEQAWAKLCLSLPCSFADYPFGPEYTVFKVSGRDTSKAKMFAMVISLQGEPALNLKCEPALSDQQRSEHPEITPGYHMNKKHWNTVHANRQLNDQKLFELIDHSYELIVQGLPKKEREKLS